MVKVHQDMGIEYARYLGPLGGGRMIITGYYCDWHTLQYFPIMESWWQVHVLYAAFNVDSSLYLTS